MTKRKKANSTATRSPRGGHPPGSPGEANYARETVQTLPTECLVAGASTLKESLRGLLDEPQPITIDITPLQRIDTAGLQVLTAFVRERAVHGRTVEWRGTAPSLTAAAQLLGLTSLLRLSA